MFQVGCRLWNLSLISVVVLTFSNILLTIRLLHSPECSTSGPQASEQKQPQQQTVLVESPRRSASTAPAPVTLAPATRACSPLLPATDATPPVPDLAVDLRLGRWDPKHLYRYFDAITVGPKFIELSQKYLVCLATQSSIEKLHSLIQVAHQWAGPISAAVYASGQDELMLLRVYIAYLRRCFPAVRDNVSFHLAYPGEPAPQPTRARFSLPSPNSFECTRPEEALSKLVGMRHSSTVKWRIKRAYPQNHMRNLARRNCQGQYVFVTDVDIIPSEGLASRLDTFLRTNRCSAASGLCAYVIPTYELDQRVRFPSNKSDLVRLARKGLARPFHHKVFIYNQFATNFSRWESESPPIDERVRVSHHVTNFEFLYEPFYVAPDSAPAHDERFIGYGFTRNTQVYEMYVAGYEFHVLTPVYTCHWGLESRKLRPYWRERQNMINGRHFEMFKSEVYARYRKDPLRMVQKAAPSVSGGKHDENQKTPSKG